MTENKRKCTYIIIHISIRLALDEYKTRYQINAREQAFD